MRSIAELEALSIEAHRRYWRYEQRRRAIKRHRERIERVRDYERESKCDKPERTEPDETLN